MEVILIDYIRIKSVRRMEKATHITPSQPHSREGNRATLLNVAMLDHVFTTEAPGRRIVSETEITRPGSGMKSKTSSVSFRQKV